MSDRPEAERPSRSATGRPRPGADPPRPATRRQFLERSGSAIGGAWLAAQLPLIQAACSDARVAASRGAAFATLTDVEARALEAIAERIFPTDETAGALEAGVIHFMDRALDGFMAWALEPTRDGLLELQSSIADTVGPDATFAGLDPEAQDEALRAIEETPFFTNVRVMTILGLFSHPDHGGNRDGVGWAAIGFEDRPVWEPPFGDYDAEWIANAADGGDG